MKKCFGCGGVFTNQSAVNNHIRYNPSCTQEKRFWGRVKKSSGCWIYDGPLNPWGYAQVGYKQKRHLAHRVSYELTYGAIPKGMLVMHICDTPACVRPLHLKLGTNYENIQDAMLKRRHTHGEKNSHAKLTEKDVRAIRKEYWFKGKRSNAVALAARYGVHPQTIVAAALKHRWKYVQ